MLMAALSRVITAKSGQPGATDQSRSDRLVLISAFVQGALHTESLISQGQYAKASAVLKQDYELVARLAEIRAGAAKAGITPQVKHAAKGSQWMYGELNKIAHPSNESMLNDLMSRLEKGDIRGVSAIPTVVPETARGLYDCHLFTITEVLREAVLLFVEMYPGEQEQLNGALRAFGYAHTFLLKASFSLQPR